MAKATQSPQEMLGNLRAHVEKHNPVRDNWRTRLRRAAEEIVERLRPRVQTIQSHRLGLDELGDEDRTLIADCNDAREILSSLDVLDRGDPGSDFEAFRVGVAAERINHRQFVRIAKKASPRFYLWGYRLLDVTPVERRILEAVRDKESVPLVDVLRDAWPGASKWSAWGHAQNQRLHKLNRKLDEKLSVEGDRLVVPRPK